MSNFNIEPFGVNESTVDGLGVIYDDKKRLITASDLRDSKPETYMVADGTEIICNDAFAGLESLKKLSMPDSVLACGNDSFANCSDLTDVEISKSLKLLGRNAFINCKNLLRCPLPDSLEEIGQDAFEDCVSLLEIHVPASLEKIYSQTFKNCQKLKTVDFSDAKIKEIGSKAFMSCESLENLILNEGLEIIKEEAFKDCKNLKSVKLPDSLEVIKSSAFENCENLESIELPEGLTEIGDSVFANCNKLKSIVLPSTLTKCMGLSKNSIEKIFIKAPKMVIFGNKLATCRNLKEIIVPIDSLDYYKTRFSALSGVEIKGEGTPKEEEKPIVKIPGRLVSRELETLINSAIRNGEISEKHMAIIKKRAELEEVDPDELDLFIDGKLSTIREELKAKEERERKQAELERKRAEERALAQKEIEEKKAEIEARFEAQKAEREKREAEAAARRREFDEQLRSQREEQERRLEEARKYKETHPYHPSNAAIELEERLREVRNETNKFMAKAEDEEFEWGVKGATYDDYRRFHQEKEWHQMDLRNAQRDAMQAVIDQFYVPENIDDVWELIKYLDPIVKPGYDNPYGPDVKAALNKKYKVCIALAQTRFKDQSPIKEYLEKLEEKKAKAKEQAEINKKKAEEKKKEESRQTAAKLKKMVEEADKAHYDTTWIGDSVLVSATKRRTNAVCAVIEAFQLPSDKKDLLGLMEMLEPYSIKKSWSNRSKWDKKIAESYYNKFNEGLELIKKLYPDDSDFSKFFPKKGGLFSKIF